MVGAPEDNLPTFNGFSLIAKGATLKGSAIGSPEDITEMLDLAASSKVKPWIQERPMNDANQATIVSSRLRSDWRQTGVLTGHQDMDKNLARYRYVLVN